MEEQSSLPRRRSVRLKGHDYSRSGAYFITICTAGFKCLFGKAERDTIRISPWGQIAHDEWIASTAMRRELELDEFVVMPNHIHGIVWLIGEDEPTPNESMDTKGSLTLRRPPKSISSFVAGYKASVTSHINNSRNQPHLPVWQRSFYDHIIRSDRALDNIRNYIFYNPSNWASDQLHPDAPPNRFKP